MRFWDKRRALAFLALALIVGAAAAFEGRLYTLWLGLWTAGIFLMAGLAARMKDEG